MIKWIKLFLTCKTERDCIDTKPFIYGKNRIRTIMNFDLFSNKKERSLQRVEQFYMPYWLKNSFRNFSEISAFWTMSQTVRVWWANSSNISFECHFWGYELDSFHGKLIHRNFHFCYEKYRVMSQTE